MSRCSFFIINKFILPPRWDHPGGRLFSGSSPSIRKSKTVSDPSTCVVPFFSFGHKWQRQRPKIYPHLHSPSCKTSRFFSGIFAEGIECIYHTIIIVVESQTQSKWTLCRLTGSLNNIYNIFLFVIILLSTAQFINYKTNK